MENRKNFRSRQAASSDFNAVHDAAERFAADTAACLIRALENGVSPYQQEWSGRGFVPYNPASGTRYRGANALRLMLEKHESPAWLTLKQASALGGRVKRGEHGVRCFFYASKTVSEEEFRQMKGDAALEKVPPSDRSASGIRIFIPCSFTVFNIDQTEGISEKRLLPPAPKGHPVDRADRILEASGARITAEEHGTRCCYLPKADVIVLPDRLSFRDNAAYYDAAMHEFAHWTGHPSRLARFSEDSVPAFGSAEYAREELRAETASLMIASSIGLPHHFGNHAAYIGEWVKVLKSDPQELIRACADADRITDYVLQYDRERAYLLDWEKKTAFGIDRPDLIARAEALINRHRLAPEGMTFREWTEQRMKERGLPKRDVEFAAARLFLSPESNSERLLAAGLCGFSVSEKTEVIFQAGAAAGGAAEKAAERLALRVLGSSGLSSCREALVSPEYRDSTAEIGKAILSHLEKVEARRSSPEKEAAALSSEDRIRLLEKATGIRNPAAARTQSAEIPHEEQIRVRDSAALSR